MPRRRPRIRPLSIDIEAAAASPEGHQIIKNEMAAFDAMSKEMRQALAESAANIDPSFAIQKAGGNRGLAGAMSVLTMDGLWQAKNRRELESGAYNSTPEQVARVKAACDRAARRTFTRRRGRGATFGAKAWLD